MSRFLKELTKATKASLPSGIGQVLLEYVISGDETTLARLTPMMPRWSLYWLSDIWSSLSEPSELSKEEKRTMHAAAVVGKGDDLGRWLAERVLKTPEAEADYLEVFREAFGKTAADQCKAALALIESGPDLGQRPEPSPIEAFLLSFTDAQLKDIVTESDRHNRLLRLLLDRAAERVPPLVEACIHRTSPYGAYIDDESCGLLLTRGGAKYEPAVAKAFHECEELGPKFDAGVELTRFNATRYQQETREVARDMLKDSNWAGNGECVCAWLLEQYGAGALAEVAGYLRWHDNSYCTEPTLRHVVKVLGKGAHPAVVAALDNPRAILRLVALGQLIQWADDADRDLIRQCFERGFALHDPQDVVRFLPAAAAWDLACLEEPIWRLVGHKSKPVRETAARILGRLGDAAVARAGELLVAKKAATRSCAVTLLGAAATDAAAGLLEARLDEEPDETVRDQILLALEAVWESKGRTMTREEIDQRIERTLPKIKGPVAAWLDLAQLPPLAYAEGGETLSGDAVRYLLYRQSRAKEMKADVEARPLYALIDRTTSGPFAQALLRMFTAGKMEADDRWALAAVGLLGDDRVVAPMMQLIRDWVDSRRGKMAEYAAQALALLGTDVALCAVDALSIRYRSKQKNIGKAAAEAFAEAAERLGVSVEELGDRVVPWLGFEPGKPRVIEVGDKRIEVAVGLDFKLTYRDLVKGKSIKSLPAAIPADVKNDQKELAATLREVVKGQLARLENLMVRQFRWPRDRWRVLYLGHPLLVPFAVRLVWGVYGADGQLLATFRALEDRTLTNEADEPQELPEQGDVAIGIVHPLELSPERRHAWASHLADYEVQSPFLQLERPVVFPAEDEKPIKMSAKYRGTSLNAMTFKGRAERLGWLRGSVCDGGGITSYRKSFPGAGADAILALDGMYIGIDMYSDIKLEQFCFVRGGSVTFGSYTYDEPTSDKDERLLAFGEVSPIVYSEILGDLGKIAGKKGEEEEG